MCWFAVTVKQKPFGGLPNTQQNLFYNCVNSSNPFPCYFTCVYGAKYDHKTTKNTLPLLIVTGSLLARSIVSTISDAAKELEKSGLNYHHYHWKNLCQRILMSANYMQLKSCRIILFYMSIYAGIHFFLLVQLSQVVLIHSF